MNHYKNKKLLCDQVVYFNRPRGPEFDDLTYVEFFKRYTYYRRSPIAFLPENHHRLSALSGIYGPKDVIVKKRLRSDNAIIRLSTLSIKSGDLYFFRQILKHEPTRSFKESKGTYKTFQESAIAKGYVANAEVVNNIFDELLENLSTPRELRSMFCILTVEGYPTLQLLANNRFYDEMTKDFSNCTTAVEKRQYLLTSFERFFKQRGKHIQISLKHIAKIFHCIDFIALFVF